MSRHMLDAGADAVADIAFDHNFAVSRSFLFVIAETAAFQHRRGFFKSQVKHRCKIHVDAAVFQVFAYQKHMFVYCFFRFFLTVSFTDFPQNVLRCVRTKFRFCQSSDPAAFLIDGDNDVFVFCRFPYLPCQFGKLGTALDIAGKKADAERTVLFNQSSFAVGQHCSGDGNQSGGNRFVHEFVLTVKSKE